VLDDVAGAATAGPALPALPEGVARWDEPDEPHHPLAGVVSALRAAGGRAVVVVACDLPLVTPALVRALAEGDAGPAGVLVARAAGRVQPLAARYEAGALAALGAYDDGGRTVEQVLALGPAFLDTDPALLRNVNAPEDLAAAQAALRGR
jgi:molybdopterin-guanine dinucleotide biosynthesis protein A